MGFFWQWRARETTWRFTLLFNLVFWPLDNSLALDAFYWRYCCQTHVIYAVIGPGSNYSSNQLSSHRSRQRIIKCFSRIRVQTWNISTTKNWFLSNFYKKRNLYIRYLKPIKLQDLQWYTSMILPNDYICTESPNYN